MTGNMEQNGREKEIGPGHAIYCQARSRYVHCAFFQIFCRLNFPSSEKNDSTVCLSVNGLCQMIIHWCIYTGRNRLTCYTLLQTQCK